MKNMDATLPQATTGSQHVINTERAGSGWLWVLLLAIVGGAVCLLGGLGISILAVVHVLAPSPQLAYVSIALLTGFFLFVFLVADCMDRLAGKERAIRLEKSTLDSPEYLDT